MKQIATEVDKRTYVLDDRRTFLREQGYSPAGELFNGCWVLRTPEGVYIDHDILRFVLAERNDIHLVHLPECELDPE